MHVVPLLCGVGIFLICLPAICMAGDTVVTAVAAKVSDDYTRVRLPDGKFEPETYAFGQGGYWSGALRDKTIDELSFTQMARTIAKPLQTQNYLPTKDPKTTKLLIMVYWGTTRASEHPSDTLAFQRTIEANDAWQRAKASGDPSTIADANEAFTAAYSLLAVENAARDRMNAKNAAVLGYDSWWEATRDLENTPLRIRRDDMIDELESNRYFVVLMAYDFQLLWKHKKHKLLWETRFSISEQRNEFDRQLATMAQEASKYFGRDSHGLVRKVQTGHVDLGELKILGVESGGK